MVPLATRTWAWWWGSSLGPTGLSYPCFFSYWRWQIMMKALFDVPEQANLLSFDCMRLVLASSRCTYSMCAKHGAGRLCRSVLERDK